MAHSILTSLGRYNKFIVSVLGALVTVGATQFPNSKVVSSVVAVLTAVGVFGTPNK